MAFRYPFHSQARQKVSHLRQGQDYFVWRSADFPVKLQGSVVEIGGPTDTGYYFLDELQLSAQPLITNISANPLPYAAEAAQLAQQVAMLMDGTAMKYEDASVQAFLMIGMSLASDWWVELDEAAKAQAAPQFEQEYAIARLEMGQVAAGLLDSVQATHAQRIKIYREVHRVLQPGGLFFTDGGIEAIAILKHMGFRLVAFLQYPDAAISESELTYEFVVAKPKA